MAKQKRKAEQSCITIQVREIVDGGFGLVFNWPKGLGCLNTSYQCWKTWRTAKGARNAASRARDALLASSVQVINMTK